MPPRRRSCLPCHISKQRCSREVPSCQSCVAQDRDHLQPRRAKRRDQRKSALKGHQMQSPEPPNNGTTVLQDCGQPAIQHRGEEQAPRVHQASFVQGTKSRKLFTEERFFKGTYGKVNNALHTTANDCLPSTTLSENVLCQSKFCWTLAYFEMPVPATLPLSYQIQGPTSCFVAAEKKPHTIHQLLLVLSYLFISAMLPEDEGALWRIIYRNGNDWEEGFVLQYDGLLSWFIRAREALTRSEALHSMSLEDLELQIRYILFILGQHASCHLASFTHSISDHFLHTGLLEPK
ncbi:hypothetical protein PMG11_11342 [Penicillium brasilianum]|uniref:Zn(2)-C6 fungal-type domain-containing protein n=1 Tax=Penicillium brasilianum TaxID=104259 RepID=A0A0F7U5V0_PENBI|nr:hypothetical protein PMG11_11342 [Penicillium brasilianum]